MKRLPLVAAACVAALAAALTLKPATAAGTDPGQCFLSSQVVNTRPDGDSTLYLRAAGNKIFRLDMREPCNGLDGSLGPLIVEPVGSGRICRPLDVNLTIRATGIAQRCRVASITPLSPAEAAALPKKVQP